jgi:hypothetical protein
VVLACEAPRLRWMLRRPVPSSTMPSTPAVAGTTGVCPGADRAVPPPPLLTPPFGIVMPPALEVPRLTDLAFGSAT